MSRQKERRSISLFGQLYDVTNIELRWLVRLAAEIFATGYGGKQPYAYAYLTARRNLRTNAKRELGSLSQDRWTKLLAAGCSLTLQEAKFIENAVERVWLAERRDIVAELVKDAREYAADRVFKHSREDGYEITPAGYSRLLKLDSQKELRDAVGQYLIFRRHWASRKVVVAHMRVWQDRLALFPAYFETRAKVPDSFKRRGWRGIIRGVMYATGDDKGIVFAIGRYVGTKQVRLTILEHVPSRQDLAGVRLGLTGGRPAGYRIWCAKLDSDSAAGDWFGLCGEYALERLPSKQRKATTRLSDDLKFAKVHGEHPHRFFQRRLGSLPLILRHLDGSSGATLSPI